MILEALFKKSALKLITVFLERGETAILSARDLSRLTNLSTSTVIEVADSLIALGVLEKAKITPKREGYKLREISTLKPYIEELINIGKEYEAYIEKNILEYIDELLGEEYYIGMYWAAMANTNPIDYYPQIYALFTDKTRIILALGLAENIYASEIQKWKPEINKSIHIAISKLDNYEDVRVGEIQGTKVRVTSVEKGIAQLFKWDVYPPYAATLALLQNHDEGRLNEEKLLKHAEKLGVKEIIKAVSYETEKTLGRKLFKKLSKGVKEGKGKPKKTWGNKPDTTLIVENTTVKIDTTPIIEAINTVYG